MKKCASPSPPPVVLLLLTLLMAALVKGCVSLGGGSDGTANPSRIGIGPTRGDFAGLFPEPDPSGTRPQTLPPFAPPAGFSPLFDGRTLDGWQGLIDGGPPAKARLSGPDALLAQAEADASMRAHWSIDPPTLTSAGVLFFDGKGESLCTIKQYADFDLLLDWMIPPGGDSGLYLRGAPQVQIWDNPVGSGGLYNNQRGTSLPLERADYPVGRWNRFLIQMRGERVWVWLNGSLVTDGVILENYWERKKPLEDRGPIELQAHGGPLWFRNLWVRERQ